MTKAQSFFGGTNPKDQATKVRQVGTSGTSGTSKGSIARKNTVKQVGHTSSGGQTFHLKHKTVGRPNVAGKEDNRNC